MVQSSVTGPTREPSLAAYLQDVRLCPMLEAEEELRQARQWRDKGERAAARGGRNVRI